MSCSPHAFRVESNHPIFGETWPVPGQTSFATSNRVLAIALAAKNLTLPRGGEIRVVHVPSGEIVYRKSEEDLPRH